MLFVALWHLLVYCPLAHWIFFYDGWLFRDGALDFAGGMVVHTSSGISGLVLAWWLGKSKHRVPHSPHSVPYVLLGAGLLWFGWFGFNAGSALGSTNNAAARALTNTQHSAAMAMLTWGVMEWIFTGDKWFSGRPTAVGSATGAIIGLVGITPACGYVASEWALFIGFFTVIVCFFAPRFIKTRLGIDDRLDVFACHGLGGIMGSLLTGLFASVEYGGSAINGGFYGDGGVLLGKQIVSILVTVAMSIIMTSLIFWAVQLTAWALKTDVRIPEELQSDVDASQHGEKAYFRAVKPVAPAIAPEAAKESATDAPSTASTAAADAV
jgi:Amt family ammonium transporter